MNSTIVVPLSGPRADRSRVSERAVPYARSLARRSHSNVLLVSVVDVPAELSSYYALPAVDHESSDGPVAERKAYLATIADAFDGVLVRTVVRVGDPADEVIMLAHELRNPVIVLASHARAGVGRAILGSVAYSIVHGVTCPVLLVPTPPADLHVPMLPERGTALVPLDGSFFSESALTQPLQVLGKPDFAVHLLYVVVPATDVTGVPIDAFVGPKEEWATHYLQSVADRLSRQGHLVTWSVRIGDVPQQIRSVADEIDADVIAMATHGRNGVGRMLFGSVTERIAHEATVPLLLIHPNPKLTVTEAVEEMEEDELPLHLPLTPTSPSAPATP